MSVLGRKQPSQQRHAYSVPHGLQFPACVSEVLAQVTTFANKHGSKWARVTNSDLQSMIDSDLFCVIPDGRVSRLNELQNLKLIGILCAYFSTEDMKGRDLRHIHFDILFCGREGETLLHEMRISFLNQLCVMALQYPVYELFDDVAQWLFKIGNGKVYAERLVTEVVDKFISVPESYKLYEYLLPLRHSAIGFAFIFLVYSASEQSMGFPLAFVIGEWLSNDLESFIDMSKASSPFSEKFASETFGVLLTYDCRNGRRDETHDRFHFAILSVLAAEWKSSSTEKSPAPRLNCSLLLNLMPEYTGFAAAGRKRFADNLECALRCERLAMPEFQLKLTNELRRNAEFTNVFNSFMEKQ